MDVFELYAKIGLDKSEYESGLKNAQGSMSTLAKNVGNGLKTVAKVGAAAVTAAATGVAALTKMGIEGYAEYEQLVGGVETLFKTSQDVVMNYAKNAYKTAGMSSNEYMSTITSFSASLIQSLDGDTAKAAEVGNMAITDMSDNANKMGTSMELIQNAYNGFAKQNYTMLDNLKLGYGGTKEEMERLIADANAVKAANGEMADLSIDSFADVAEAIHIIQNEMGITGTTSREAATTIEGSLSMMKGAWTNLVVGMADENANMEVLIGDFVESVATAAQNLLPRIGQTLAGIGQLVAGVAPVIVDALPGLVSTVLPPLLNAAIGLVNSLVSVLPSLVDTLMTAIIGALPAFIDACVQITNGVVSFLPSLIAVLVAAFPVLLPQLVNGMVSMIVMLCTMLPQIIQPIIDNLPAILISIIDALMSNLPALIEGLITLILGIVAALPQITQALIDAMPMIIEMVITGLFNALPQLIAGLVQFIGMVAENCMGSFAMFADTVVGVFTGIWEALKNIFAPAAEWVDTNVIQPVADFFVNLWNGIKNGATAAWEGLKNVFSVVSQWFNKTVIMPVKNFFTGMWDGLKTGATNAWNGIKSVFSNVTNWFKDVFSKAWQAVKNVFSTGGKVFDGIKEGIVDVFKTVVNAIIGGINKVISVPFNAINSVLQRIKNIEIVGIKPFDWVQTFSVPQIPKLSTGLNFVPYDEYPAFLHRGEAVLTAAQARAWRNGQGGTTLTGDNGQVVSLLLSILNAITGGNEEMIQAILSDKHFVVGEREFARAVRQYA